MVPKYALTAMRTVTPSTLFVATANAQQERFVFLEIFGATYVRSIDLVLIRESGALLFHKTQSLFSLVKRYVIFQYNALLYKNITGSAYSKYSEYAFSYVTGILQYRTVMAGHLMHTSSSDIVEILKVVCDPRESRKREKIDHTFANSPNGGNVWRNRFWHDKSTK